MTSRGLWIFFHQNRQNIFNSAPPPTVGLLMMCQVSSMAEEHGGGGAHRGPRAPAMCLGRQAACCADAAGLPLEAEAEPEANEDGEGDSGPGPKPCHRAVPIPTLRKRGKQTGGGQALFLLVHVLCSCRGDSAGTLDTGDAGNAELTRSAASSPMMRPRAEAATRRLRCPR